MERSNLSLVPGGTVDSNITRFPGLRYLAMLVAASLT